MSKRAVVLLLCLIGVAAGSRVSLHGIHRAGRKLQASIVVPWRLNVHYETLYLTVGDAVTFRWSGESPHSLALAPGPGDCTGLKEVGDEDTSGAYTVVLAHAGTYTYTSAAGDDCYGGLEIVIHVEALPSWEAPEVELW